MLDVRARYISGDDVLLADCATVNDSKVKIALRHENHLAPSVTVLDHAGAELTDDDAASPADVTVVLVQHAYDDDLYKKGLIMHAIARDPIGVNRAMAMMLTRGGGKKQADPATVAGGAVFAYVESRKSESRKDVVEMLVAASADVRCRLGYADNVLMCAIKYNLLDIVPLLLDAKCNVGDICGSFRRSPVLLAAHAGHSAMVRMLLDANADVNHGTWYDLVDDMVLDFEHTALHVAAQQGHGEVARMLLEARANVNDANAHKETSLHFAAKYGNDGVMRMLLDANANVDAKGVIEMTALHMAAEYGHVGVVRMLLDAKANADDEDGRKWTPLRAAEIRGRSEVAHILEGRAGGH
eukprot:GEMP01020504.1.p1 GENE.GEMP01020504.1~~GEMP01020504.1.p1  ORF type:complete len:355 (+),score=111.24 GEMP01020504.1:40-1104(+)